MPGTFWKKDSLQEQTVPPIDAHPEHLSVLRAFNVAHYNQQISSGGKLLLWKLRCLTGKQAPVRLNLKTITS